MKRMTDRRQTFIIGAICRGTGHVQREAAVEGSRDKRIGAIADGHGRVDMRTYDAYVMGKEDV